MGREEDMVRIFTFSQFHNKHPVTGSTQIRVNQLIKYWPEADLYKYGENPDVLIFQKVYVAPDYRFPLHFKGQKILDICDPDWYNGKTNVVETINAMDAVTCPTEHMANFLRQLTDKPVRVLKDRFDLEVVPEPKVHHGDAKTVVWFGYRHNIETLKPAMYLIDELNLSLLVISDDDPLAYQWSNKDLKDRYKYIKYNENTIYSDLQKADFAIFPRGLRPEDAFKSENKTVKAILAGLPVANDSDSVKQFLKESERQAWIDEQRPRYIKEYDVRKSVNEMKELIEEIKNG